MAETRSSELPGIILTCVHMLCYTTGDVCVQGLDKRIPVLQLNLIRLSGKEKYVRGRPLMIWERPRGNQKNKNPEALLQEKNKSQRAFPRKINLKRPSPGKILFSKGISAEKINPFSIFPPGPPQIING